MASTEFSRVADQMVLKMILRSKMADEMALYKAQSLAKEKTLAFNSLNSVSRKRPQPVGKDSLEQVKPQKLQKRAEEDDLTKWARAEREAAEQLIKELDEIINAEQKDFPIQPQQEMSFDELINEIDDILGENSEQTSLGQTTKQEVNVEKPTFTSDDSYTANKPLLQRPTTIQPDIAEQISHDTPELPKPTVETSSGIPFLNQTKHLSFEHLCHDASEMPKHTGVPFLKNHELIDQVRNTQQQEFIEEPRCLTIEKPSESVAVEDLCSKLFTRRVDSQQRLGTYQKQTTSNVISSFQVLQQQSTYKSSAHDQPTFQAVSMPALQQTAERQSFTPRYISICFSPGAHEQPTFQAVSMPAMQSTEKRQQLKHTPASFSSGAHEQPTFQAESMSVLQPPVKMQQPRYIPAHFSSGSCVKPIKKRVHVMCVPDVKRPPIIHHSLNITPPRKRPPTIDNSLNISPPRKRPPTIDNSLNIPPPGKRPPTIDNSRNIPPPGKRPPTIDSSRNITPPGKRPPTIDSSRNITPPGKRPPTIDSSRNITPPGKRPPTIDSSRNITPPGKPVTNHSSPTWQGTVDTRKRKATQDQDEAPKPKKKFRLIPVGFP